MGTSQGRHPTITGNTPLAQHSAEPPKGHIKATSKRVDSLRTVRSALWPQTLLPACKFVESQVIGTPKPPPCDLQAPAKRKSPELRSSCGVVHYEFKSASEPENRGSFVLLSARICAARANSSTSCNLFNPSNSFNCFGCGFAALGSSVVHVCVRRAGNRLHFPVAFVEPAALNHANDRTQAVL
jgi:hypothetical protein